MSTSVLPNGWGMRQGNRSVTSPSCEIQQASVFFFFSSVGVFTTLASRRRGFGYETQMDSLELAPALHTHPISTATLEQAQTRVAKARLTPPRREGVQSTSPPQRPVSPFGDHLFSFLGPWVLGSLRPFL